MIHFQSIIIDYFCYFIETDNENPIEPIIVQETSVRVGRTKSHSLKFFIFLFRHSTENYNRRATNEVLEVSGYRKNLYIEHIQKIYR